MELIPYKKENKILRETTIPVAEPTEDGGAAIVNKKVVQEKILILKFNDGGKIIDLVVSNLAEPRGKMTKEQVINNRLLERSGHIRISGLHPITIRVSNIISIREEWRTI